MDQDQEQHRSQDRQPGEPQGHEQGRERGEVWGWTRAFATREICDRLQRAVEEAFADAMLVEGVSEEVRGRVVRRVSGDLFQRGDLELWAAQLPPSLPGGSVEVPVELDGDPDTGLTGSGEEGAGVGVLDAFSLLRFRLVVPSWRVGDRVAREAAEAVTRTHSRLMKQAGVYARAEAQAREAGDGERLERVRLRAQATLDAAGLLAEELWSGADLGLFEQFRLTDHAASRDTFDAPDPERWTQVPGLPWPDLHHEPTMPRQVLVMMIEQVRAVRAHFAGMSVRYASEASEQLDVEAVEHRALGRTLAVAADAIDAALAAGAGRGSDLGDHIAKHGRQIDYVI